MFHEEITAWLKVEFPDLIFSPGNSQPSRVQNLVVWRQMATTVFGGSIPMVEKELVALIVFRGTRVMVDFDFSSNRVKEALDRKPTELQRRFFDYADPESLGKLGALLRSL